MPHEKPTGDRFLALSPKARRVVVPFVALVVLIIVVGSILSRGSSDDGPESGPRVGGDLPILATLDVQTFVGDMVARTPTTGLAPGPKSIPSTART